jgi:hypothetical protein
MADCRDCKYSHNREGATLDCQRYPRSIKVGRTYWCGEFVEEMIVPKIATQEIPAMTLKGKKNEK